MTACTCDTHSASTNSTVLTVDNTSASSSATQVLYAHSNNGNMPYVVYAEGAKTGVLGKSYVQDGIGILGQATSANGDSSGVVGQTAAFGGAGVHGDNSGGGYGVYGSGGYGVYGINTGPSGYGVFATATTGTALYVAGTATVIGAITKPGGGYKIDHPADPENRFLYHCFVESPEMMNVYRGRAQLDANGESTVSLPAYFEVANERVECILTAIGGPMPNLHISEEMKDGKFKISGGSAGKSVSWHVSAARADKWAKANHPGVEIEKSPSEKGLLMHPELYGFDEEKSIVPRPGRRV